MRWLFGSFTALGCFLGHQGTAGRAHEIGGGGESTIEEARNADHQPVQADDQHEKAAHQGDGESDAEEIELRRGARNHAEREIHDHERDHGGQRDQQPRLEHLRAPDYDRPQKISVEVRTADGQGLEAHRQRADEREMTVHAPDRPACRIS